MVWKVETLLESDFEALKVVLNVETRFEVDFGGANEKFAYMRILILSKKIPPTRCRRAFTVLNFETI